MENSRMTKQTLKLGRRMEKEEQRQKSPERMPHGGESGQEWDTATSWTSCLETQES